MPKCNALLDRGPALENRHQYARALHRAGIERDGYIPQRSWLYIPVCTCEMHEVKVPGWSRYRSSWDIYVSGRTLLYHVRDILRTIESLVSLGPLKRGLRLRKKYHLEATSPTSRFRSDFHSCTHSIHACLLGSQVQCSYLKIML